MIHMTRSYGIRFKTSFCVRFSFVYSVDPFHKTILNDSFTNGSAQFSSSTR